MPLYAGNIERDVNYILKNSDCFMAGNVTGKSMGRYYPLETVAVIKKTDYASLLSGQIVVYNNGGRFIIHALIEKVSGGWIAKGSDNKKNDSILVTEENLIGVVYATLSGKLKNSNFFYANSD